ncbi:gliding motility-associated C-terminal domain-containing protein [bacterium SCSIO 12741]|nr:gliding motility-associated C-terminal domain-containing protein [bacterium SCSIO 12741]
MSPLEGCASISNPLTGALLFYTDGIQVFNRNHQQMGNGFGLLGHSSASHSAVIVPFIGNPNKYYVFTVPANPTIGAHYSIVDMTLNNGLGDVVAIGKNTIINPTPNFQVSDKLSAVSHANGRDVWVVIQNEMTWDFYAYLVTSAGVSTTPVISTASRSGWGGVGHYGCMKFSPDGKFLCAVAGSNDNLKIMSFNSLTGKALPLVDVTSSLHYDFIYGVEFSPNSKLLYISIPGRIYQFDLTLSNSAAIQNSRTIIGTISGSGLFAQMQLAPDKKIYIARPGKNFLSRIDFPDSAGTACNYVSNAATLPSGAYCEYGLPTFIQSFFETTDFDVQNACDGQYVKIALKDANLVDSVYYDYGDPSTGALNNSWNPLDSHFFSRAGKFKITAHAYYTDGFGRVYIDTLYDSIDIKLPPIVSLPGDTILCAWDSIEAKISQTTNYSLLWGDSSTGNFLPIDSAGTYWVTARNHCGQSSDTVEVDSLLLRHIDLGPDTLFCVGDTLRWDLSDTLATYLWSDGSTTPLYEADTTETIWAEVSNFCGVKRDTILVERVPMPHTDLGSDTAVCIYSNFVLGSSREPWMSYVWHTGQVDTSQVIANKSGWYWLEKSTLCGAHRDSVRIIVQDSLQLNLGNDTLICFGDTLHFHIPDSPATVTWQDGATTSRYLAFETKTYSVEVMNTCGFAWDTLNLTVLKPPVVDLPSDTAICQGDTLWLDISNPLSTYAWSDGSTNPTFALFKPSTYWGQATNLCGVDQGQVNFALDISLSLNLGGDTILCDDAFIELGQNFPNRPKYHWSTGAKSAKIQVNAAGTYRLTVTNSCGSYRSERNVTMQYSPDPYLGPDQLICAGEEWELTTGMTESELLYSTVTWQHKHVQETFRVNESKDWIVEVQNYCGIGYDTFNLHVEPLPKVRLPLDTLYCDEPFYIDLTSYPYYLEWEDGSNDNMRWIDQHGDYQLLVRDDHGCENYLPLNIKRCPNEFYFPNSFTPNRDQVNDRFRVFKADLINFDIQIFNRWNELIYESGDIEEGWDGTRMDNGTECPVGQYLWKVEFKEDYNHQTQVLTGQVYLIR